MKSVAAQKPVTAHKPAASLPAKYTVRPGDTLTAIARNLYHDPDAWPVLYWANRDRIHWANSIDAGLVLTVPVKPARIPSAPSQLAPAPAPAPAVATEQSSPAEPAQTVQTASTYTGGSSFQQCVIARESGGDSQVTNASGHYGLYQFSASTWAAYGGNPADFGNASVGEQNQVFDTAIADGGSSNWSAYDGC
jgi:Transglycosylase-like domain